METGPIRLRGDLYIVDRNTPLDPVNGILTGRRVGRLKEVLAYRLNTTSQVGRKSSSAPQWARITGDSITIELTLEDWNEDMLSIMTNKRSSGIDFIPGEHGVKLGHILRESDLHALVIRDSGDVGSRPGLYIPYAFTLDSGWLSARRTGHTELCELVITSVDYRDDVHPFVYGNLVEYVGTL